MPSVEQSNFPEQYAVTVTTPDELVALRSLGLTMRRLGSDSSENDTPLTDEAFWATSQILFGTDAYGRGAGDYVHLLGEGAKSTATVSRRGTEWDFDTQAWEFRVSRPKGIENLTGPFTPFPLRVERLPGKSTKLRVTPGALSVQSLAAFVTARQYARHKLHGAIGKTLDVLVHTANMTPLHGPVEAPEDDFITYDELTSIIDESIPGNTADVLRDKIGKAFVNQLLSGKPRPKGEVIFEGGFEIAINGSNVTVKYGTVARRSLRVIAEDYSRTTAAKQLLLDISA